MAAEYFLAFLNRTHNTPDLPFFELRKGKEHVVYSFAEFSNHVQSAAAALAASGVAKGDIVLIFAQHSLGMLATFFGAQLLGATPAFMPPPTPRQDYVAWRKNHIALIARIRPQVIVAEPSCFEAVQALGAEPLLSTDAIETWPRPAGLRLPQAQLDDVAFLQHSSGTTGLKKGVMVTYRQLLAQVETYRAALKLDVDHAAIVSWLPLYHDMGLIAATLTPFTLGLRTRIIDTLFWLGNPKSFIDLLVDTPDAYAWLPDFAFRYLAQRAKLPASPDALRGVKAIINCSEPCKSDSMEMFRRKFEPCGLPGNAVQICYAMAEYVFAVTQSDPMEGTSDIAIDRERYERDHVAEVCSDLARSKTIVCVGSPLDGVQLRIEGAQTEGEVGQILVSGPSLCSGYFKNDELTTKRFVDGWYNTGDLGFLLNNRLYVSGRLDDLIIIRGRNIYAHDIEEAISQLPGIKAGRTVALGVDNQEFGSQDLVIVAELEGPDNNETVEASLRNIVVSQFGLSPIDVLLLAPNSLIKTSSGKISRSENLRRYLAGELNSWTLVAEQGVFA